MRNSNESVALSYVLDDVSCERYPNHTAESKWRYVLSCDNAKMLVRTLFIHGSPEWSFRRGIPRYQIPFAFNFLAEQNVRFGDAAILSSPVNALG